METISQLSFPYFEASESKVRLNKLIATDECNEQRITVSIGDDRLAHFSTRDENAIKGEDIVKLQRPLEYTENEFAKEKTQFPLLLQLTPHCHKLKLHVSLSRPDNVESKSLLIAKSRSATDVLDLRNATEATSTLITNLEENSDISKIEYKDLPISKDTHGLQKLIINDTFDAKSLNGTRLVVSLWEHDQLTGNYSYCFHFSVYISKLEQNIDTSIHNAANTKPLKNVETFNTSDTNLLKIGDFRKEFKFDIEDGPAFRKTLSDLENAIPSAHKIYSKLIDDFKVLESNVRRMSSTKFKIIEGINQLVDLESQSLLTELKFKESFQKAFRRLFEAFEININFFFDHVCASKQLVKIENSIPALQIDNANQTELSQMKRQFESDSKEYYSWMNKYLANDKERPDSKLLAKRKVFELSKFDYLNQLSKTTNNQYVNELCENLFQFINLGFSKSNSRVLDVKKYLDKSLKHELIGDNYQIYLHALTRFNSEKYQFRQKIEACQTNEELTNLIRYNTLNHMNQAAVKSQLNDAFLHSATTDEFMVTKENFDLIFSDSIPPAEGHGTASATSSTSSSSMAIPDSDSSEMSGILFTLNGQKKQGWHKEWVVLKNGRLIEYADWRKGKTPINKPIEVALSNVKAISHDKRQYCFEIYTSTGQRHVFQAFGNDDRNKWVKALYNAGQLVNKERIEQSVNTTTSSGNIANAKDKDKDKGKDKEKDKDKERYRERDRDRDKDSDRDKHKEEKRGMRRNVGKLVTDFALKPIIPGQHGSDRSVSPISITSKIPIEKDHLHFVRSIPHSDNHICVDCGLFELVEWVSINSLVCMCVNCASCHRSIGSHITKIRSLKLDKFENELEVMLGYINNRKVNEYLEFAVSASEKLQSSSDIETRLLFIRNKYAAKKYIQLVADVDNSLIQAIQKIQVGDALKYILCGADVNINIQVKLPDTIDTQVISLFEYSLRKYIEVDEDELRHKKLFVVSELLILNGCTNVGSEVTKLKTQQMLSNDAIDYWRNRCLKI